MFCPNCGNERMSEATIYCNRCGFLLTGTAELIANGGVSPTSIAPTNAKAISPRKKGLKQGLFIFLLTFLVVPVIGIFTEAIGAQPFAVGIAAVSLFMGGLLRMVYALMFESGDPGGATLEQKGAALVQQIIAKQNAGALPESRMTPAADFLAPQRGDWRDTTELEPSSVTESTTRLLSREEKI